MNVPLRLRDAIDEAINEGIITDKDAHSIAFAYMYARDKDNMSDQACALLASVIRKYIRANTHESKE